MAKVVHVSYYQIFDEKGCHNYKIVDGKMVETTEEEKQAEINARPKPAPTQHELIQETNKSIKTVSSDTLLNMDMIVSLDEKLNKIIKHLGI